MRQLTIFDVIEPECQDWQDMSLKELATYIGDRTGLHFIPDTRFHGEFNEYIAYYTSKVFFTVGIGHYTTYDERNGKPFISVEYENKNDHSGSGAPCDSLEEAISYFKSYTERTETE